MSEHARRSRGRIAVTTTACIVSFGALIALASFPAAAQGGTAIPRVVASPSKSPVASPTPATSPVIAAVGDIACAPSSGSYKGGKGTNAGCQQNAVGALLKGRTISAFLPLGDEQYQVGALAAFKVSYQRAFGAYLAITRPVPGNHEYNTSGASGYYAYFGASAHESSHGSYSYDIGSWHVIAINAPVCSGASCSTNTTLMRWLQADLKAHAAAKCTVAYWHEPLWSTGLHPTYVAIAPVWNALERAGVDLVLTGHDHNYQRFAPLGLATFNLARGTVQPPKVDRVHGMRQFVVGTGGESNYPWGSHIPSATVKAVEVRATNPNHGVFGVLLVTLNKTSYSWKFIQARTTGAAAFSDSGSTACH
jgi:hypothetical protein